MGEDRVLELEKGRQARRSADVVSAIRFQETQRGEPLINDPFAHLFVSPEGEEMLALALKRWPFFAEYIIARDKYFDDHLTAFCQEGGVRQIVLLGAGNDMRAARLLFLKGKKVFEVDLSDQMRLKKAILLNALGKLPEQAVYVEADVTEDDFVGRLVQAGFVPNEKSAFIIEGLIYYLKPKGVDSLFEELGQIPLIGNLFLIDQISAEMQQKALDPERRGKPPYPEDVASYLSRRDFSIRERALLGNLTEKYYGKSYREKWWVVAAEK
ncbi:MAG: class I SAM-dependent methyltransferase [Proteobacteria bacterium]|nr:class I SAM-dependent methyltransferase [Pseudomonadota bacterium]